jgi:hypothetical protein
VGTARIKNNNKNNRDRGDDICIDDSQRAATMPVKMSLKYGLGYSRRNRINAIEITDMALI